MIVVAVVVVMMLVVEKWLSFSPCFYSFLSLLFCSCPLLSCSFLCMQSVLTSSVLPFLPRFTSSSPSQTPAISPPPPPPLSLQFSSRLLQLFFSSSFHSFHSPLSQILASLLRSFQLSALLIFPFLPKSFSFLAPPHPTPPNSFSHPSSYHFPSPSPSFLLSPFRFSKRLSLLLPPKVLPSISSSLFSFSSFLLSFPILYSSSLFFPYNLLSLSFFLLSPFLQSILSSRFFPCNLLPFYFFLLSLFLLTILAFLLPISLLFPFPAVLLCLFLFRHSSLFPLFLPPYPFHSLPFFSLFPRSVLASFFFCRSEVFSSASSSSSKHFHAASRIRDADSSTMKSRYTQVDSVEEEEMVGKGELWRWPEEEVP